MKHFKILSKLSLIILVLALSATLTACELNINLKSEDDESDIKKAHSISSKTNEESNKPIIDGEVVREESNTTDKDNESVEEEIIIEYETVIVNGSSSQSTVSEPTVSEPTVSDDLVENPINFTELQKNYPDACAWIQIPGIDIIDYPIMQSGQVKDDNYYLNHNMNGKESRAGELYIQKINDKSFCDYNTVIYGHAMANGTMFGNLKKFRNETFFDEHEVIYIYTPGHILEYQVISAFTYDDRHIINSFDFDNTNDRLEFFNTCINPSSDTKNVRENVTLKSDDKIITLSTPTANSGERYLVIGKLISDTKTK